MSDYVLHDRIVADYRQARAHDRVALVEVSLVLKGKSRAVSRRSSPAASRPARRWSSSSCSRPR